MTPLLLCALLGTWQYEAYRYKGTEIDRTDSGFTMQFTFDCEGNDRLFWQYQGQKTFCDRRGKFTVSEGQITDEVTWVNPENAKDCANDPSMQLGSQASFAFRFQGNRLETDSPLGDDVITYLWRQQSSVGPSRD